GAAAAAEPACADGAERACHVPVAVQGRVVTCYDGTERCAAGAWGPCEDGALSAFELPREVAGLGAEIVTETTECDGNICDPNCRAFYEAPAVAIETPPGEEIFSWTAGSIADLRAKGLVKKAFEEPCSSGFDCQFNHHCDDPITHPSCTHSKCKPGIALDAHCEDGYIDPSSSNQETCVGMICDVMPDCCVRSYAGACPRDPCITGVPFKSDCDADVTAVCAALPSCCGVPIGGADPIVREAEQYDVIVSRSGQTWVQVAEPTASGGIAFRAQPDTGVTWARNKISKSPSLVLTVNFGLTGTWYVWVRGRAGGSTVATSDTVHIGIDDTVPASAASVGPFGVAYGWVGALSTGGRATLSVASKGNHEIDVYMAEDGFVVDMVYLTQNGAFSPPVGFLPAAGGGGIGVWSPDCVAKYEAVTGVDCGGGDWDEDCVALVDPVCNATCGVYEDDTCEHSPCDTSGAALEPTCHPCVSEICRISPTCCITGWSAACASLVASACDLTCPIDRKIAPPEAGQCLPWMPGEQDPGCIGPDLSISVPCEGIVPICNHGTQTAEAPIRIIYYSANSSHYTNDDPDQTKTDGECIVDQDVKPGHCVELDVTSATCSFGQNKTVMVNPPKYLATDPEIAECGGTSPAFAGRGRTDNWALYRDDISCEAPACAEQDTTSAFRKVFLYFMVDKSGTMIAARWEGMKQALETFFASPEADTLHVGMEFFPLDNSVPEQGDGCADITVGLCDALPCANPMVPVGELTVAPSDPQELLLRTAIESVSPAGPTGWTTTYPALSGAILAQKNAHAAAPGEVYATVLVTDGYPSACESSTAELAKLALEGYVNNDILTYTIGSRARTSRRSTASPSPAVPAPPSWWRTTTRWYRT
ncbi:MAG TPA: hypothetical protein PLU22_15555, partial [Polyangiaceae bacterium]|nr:hypothetical protein [Polyangiaceae bacterium]